MTQAVGALPAHDPTTRLRPLRAVTRRALLWAVAAVLGIVITAALTWSVSRLTRERIGLSAESPSVVGGLAPPRALPPGRTTRTPTKGAPETEAECRPGPCPNVRRRPISDNSEPAPGARPAGDPETDRGDSRDDSGSGSGSGGSRGAPDD